ncbi:hypothetical protein GCM10010976_12750 [Bizionia arctica]|uniref:Uncharacterized protein n=1 Tax=Bizionia arctica TaxID=1495645 RepID=A0A917GFB1_9FLAO|nr:hypothetical protein GCM10010976_12750 [Bizionia arctica]
MLKLLSISAEIAKSLKIFIWDCLLILNVYNDENKELSLDIITIYEKASCNEADLYTNVIGF